MPRKKKTDPNGNTNPNTTVVNTVIPTPSLPSQSQSQSPQSSPSKPEKKEKKTRDPTVYNYYVQKRMAHSRQFEDTERKKWIESGGKLKEPKLTSAVEKMNMFGSEWLSDDQVRTEMTKEFEAWKLTNPKKADGTAYFKPVSNSAVQNGISEPATK
jgi:hypothetical protein